MVEKTSKKQVCKMRFLISFDDHSCYVQGRLFRARHRPDMSSLASLSQLLCHNAKIMNFGQFGKKNQYF